MVVKVKSGMGVRKLHGSALISVEAKEVKSELSGALCVESDVVLSYAPTTSGVRRGARMFELDLEKLVVKVGEIPVVRLGILLLDGMSVLTISALSKVLERRCSCLRLAEKPTRALGRVEHCSGKVIAMKRVSSD